MDPVSTELGVASSLVTLTALAANSCEIFYNIIRRIKDAPKDIKDLLRDVEAFHVLLADVERASNQFDETDISTGMKELWTKKGAEMKSDLESFQSLAEKLASAMEGPTVSSKSVRARVKRLLSQETTAEYKRAFSSHIEVLGYIRTQIVG